VETRPVLDAVGAGAHRVSEIAGRMGRPATSLSRPIDRLVEMGLLRREVPFGEPERKTKRSLYRIEDPFFRLWFRVVAPNRGALTSGSRAMRLDILDRHWPSLVASAWEDLCRKGVSRARRGSALAKLGPWRPASRWWRGEAPEWDLISESQDGKRLLFGEAKWTSRPLGPRQLSPLLDALASKPLPPVSGVGEKRIVRVVFVPDTRRSTLGNQDAAMVVTASDVLG
ncbi:MAG: ATP-binding protein, partial [Vicinamibacteria bacterium]